jgi:hypothetical protein
MEETDDGNLLEVVKNLEIGYVIFGLAALIFIALFYGDATGFTLHWR